MFQIYRKIYFLKKEIKNKIRAVRTGDSNLIEFLQKIEILIYHFGDWRGGESAGLVN